MMDLDLHGGKLCVLSGRGDLPKHIFAHCETVGLDCHAIYFKGQMDEEPIPNVPYDTVKLGQIQKTIDILKKNNCTHVVFAGALTRPSLFDLKPDLRTAKFITRMGLGAMGDDRLLRAVRAEFEKEGFLILGAHDILPDLLTEKQCFTQRTPSDVDWADIKTGYTVLNTLGPLDVGQSCVVQHGVVLGIEAIEGTDALIERAGDHKRSDKGGILVKCAKRGQDASLDVPTIGEMTVRNMAAAGLAGIAVEAGKSQILNQTEAIVSANAAGLFVVGFSQDDLENV